MIYKRTHILQNSTSRPYILMHSVTTFEETNKISKYTELTQILINTKCLETFLQCCSDYRERRVEKCIKYKIPMLSRKCETMGLFQHISCNLNAK